VRHEAGHVVARDGTRLATRTWFPAREPRAVVQLVHGLGEHVGRHERLAVDLTRAGFAVHGFDLRGHGYSQGARVNVRRFDRYLDDLAVVVASAPPAPALVLLGHSLGGLVAARAVQDGVVKPDLLVLSAPLLAFANPPPRPVVRLVVALARVFPGMPVAGVDPKRISSIAAEAEAYRLDPAVHHGPVKARVLAEILRHGPLAVARARDIAVPTLLLQGKDDPVVDVAVNGAFARDLRDGTVHLYDACRHEFFHDVLGKRATNDLLAWLDERLSPAGRPARA